MFTWCVQQPASIGLLQKFFQHPLMLSFLVQKMQKTGGNASLATVIGSASHCNMAAPATN